MTSLRTGMYLPEYEHDACGIGLLANIKNQASHRVVADALLMLENMAHRGGVGAEPETGDGAGIMTGIPHEFFRGQLPEKLPLPGEYGVGMLFLPTPLWESCLASFLKHVQKQGFRCLAIREVPTNDQHVGPTARETAPKSVQVFLTNDDKSEPALQRSLYLLKKTSSHSLRDEYPDFYISSLSTNRIIYKGQLRSDQLKKYYTDLQAPAYVSAFAIIHSRFSTNTLPRWSLAQPFRHIAHNGEINTIRGNVNKMKSKELLMQSEFFSHEQLEKIRPICRNEDSDSANLDEIIELLTITGRSLPHALMMLVPEAWQYNKRMDETTKAFYKYSASLMEPWDGPAALCFADGRFVGATLDRNGLRPCRYTITRDDRLIIASETGALPVDPKLVLEKGHLQPGKMIVADLKKGRVLYDKDIKSEIVQRQPYADWIKKHRIKLRFMPGPFTDPEMPKTEKIHEFMLLHNWTQEDVDRLLHPMALDGKEPIGSMGLEVPLASLSQRGQHPSNYLKQIFAQVSNPPIDPIRERLVMSLFTRLGKAHNILDEKPEDCHQVHITRPVLRPATFQKVLELAVNGFTHRFISIGFKEKESLQQGLDHICREAEQATREGIDILILSDREVGTHQLPIPSLMALGAVHHHLLDRQLRAQTSLIVHAADVLEVHHFATLIGYGASAVMPWLVFGELDRLAKERRLNFEEITENYVQAVGKGLLKVMSKMGISTLQSYQAAQIFEAIGLADEVVDKCFKGTVNRLGGNGFAHFERIIRAQDSRAITKPGLLPHGGVYAWRRDQEKHLFDPDAIAWLQKATKLKDYDLYKKYAKRINEPDSPVNLRHLLTFRKGNAVPLEEVEPAEKIMTRFATGAMSFGSISHEAHTTLAIAMNRIGGKSNSGEGGEDASRFTPLENGDSQNSRIKQVASGRFGVTSHYLNNADEIQIKIAQGAKPGEGGQLPGHKVDDWIAKVRMSTPGVDLISPPPHHDIYSIEDLAQLIFDLKNANPDARLNVKLVSETGIGTIAAGVVKGYADVILVSGADGGTGASPLSSIRHAGVPWEMGLSEVQQTLLKNRLRSRIVLQADGKMMTGRDLAIATLLGAEEWGVSTAALIVEGCIMMRKCHLNTCPVGIATQRTELRKLFTGDPDHVVQLFRFLTEELREYMAMLGFRTINEMVGQCDRLEQISDERSNGLDLSPILVKESSHDTLYHSRNQKDILEGILDERILADVKDEIEVGETSLFDYPIQNTDRAVGTRLSSYISRRFGPEGLTGCAAKIGFKGAAGQSFGAFLTKGIEFTLEGDANDYVGKGLSGGQLVIYPPRSSRFVARKNTLIGNVALYGATSGNIYIRGIAGERFAVRNSGASAVVEGCGDHGCEYMTGGKVVVLGPTGKNFAAGMSGGIAYVLDPGGNLRELCNLEMVIFDALNGQDVAIVRQLVINHLKYTGSSVAQELLLDWNRCLNHLVKVIPQKYKEMIEKGQSEMPMTPMY